MRFGLAPAFVVVSVFAAAHGCGGGGGGSSSGSSANPSPRTPATFRAVSSQKDLPFSNGYSAGSYSLATHKVDSFRDHIYAGTSAQVASKNFCYDLFFGYRRGGSSQWLTQVLESEAGYVEGTGILKVVQRAAGLRFETYYFAPMTGGATHAMVAIVRARNEGASATDSSLFLELNFKLGGGSDATGEWAFFDGQAPYGPYIMEGKSGTGNRIVMKPIGAAPTHSSYAGSGASSPFARVNAGEHLVDPSGALNADDISCGFEWVLGGTGNLAAGAEAWAGAIVAYGSTGDEDGLKKAASDFVAGKSPEDILARELLYWDGFHSVETPPANASAAERALFRQSTAAIKMAQCREPGAPEGQILASLPPGQWNICWPRDAAYAIVALARTGHADEAKKGLEFFLRGTADSYRSYIGRKYRISVARYYGDGVEESDDNGNGPNIELDNFGLFLWAFAEYIERSGDTAFLDTHYALVRDEVADALVSCIDANGLVKADSSIWERHLTAAAGTPDGKKQFAYTSINAANGLARAAALATRKGDAAKASEWTAASDRIRAAIESALTFGDGAIASSLEEKAAGRGQAADASVIEAVNHGLVAATSTIARGTFDYLDRELKAWPLRSPGYLRCDDARSYGPNNWYDRQEWVVIDLRMASAFVRAGRAAEARALLDWVTAQSAANRNLVAELYDEVSSSYAGAVPMIGFGAGAYILALSDLLTGPR